MERMIDETGLTVAEVEMMLEQDPNSSVTPDIEQTPETEAMTVDEEDAQINPTDETEDDSSQEEIDVVEVETGADAVEVESRSEPSEAMVEENTEVVVNVDVVDDILVPNLPLNNQIWSQDSPNIELGSEDNDNFGEVVATGDFDGDGYDDLAIGVRNEDLGSGANEITNAGAVNIIYGSSLTGLTASGDQIWRQNTPGVRGAAEAFDRFGSSLAAGDFDNDGYDDLAIGVPGEDVGTINSAGAVNILYGSASGLTATGDQIWTQNSPGLVSGMGSEADDEFGTSVATGDFNEDGYADLAIGVPGEDVFSISNGGAVNIIYGSASGLTATDSQIWHQNTFGDQASPVISGTAEAGDNFGESLTTGDFDGDGYDDLGIGVPNEDIGTIASAGAVNVIYGNVSGLTPQGNQLWHQNSLGIEGVAEAGDNFGESLTTGDFDGDGYDDLGIGVPNEDIGTIISAGAVNVLYGSSNSLSATDNQIWHQNTSGIQGEAEDFDQFGFSLSAGDFDNDSYDDLAIGVRGENLATGPDELINGGAVNIIQGSATHLTHRNDRLITQATLDMSDEPAEAFDEFGFSLAVGDFNGDNYGDLAVGVPFEEASANITNSGAVNVLYDV